MNNPILLGCCLLCSTVSAVTGGPFEEFIEQLHMSTFSPSKKRQTVVAPVECRGRKDVLPTEKEEDL